MFRILIVIAISVAFSSLTLAQSTQTRLNGTPSATTRIADGGVQFKGNVGELFTTTVSNAAGQRVQTGTWKLLTRLRAVPVSVDETTPEVAHEFWLGQNYPNPFNPTTVIPFSLDKQGFGELVITNLLGQTLRKIDLSGYSAGAHFVTWDGRNDSGQLVSSGPLFYRISTEKHSTVHRMLLLK